MTELRVAIVGLGHKGLAHLRSAQACTGVRAVGLLDPDPAAVAQAAAITDAPVFADLPALIGTARPDVVVVATPPQHHAAVATAAFAGGAHVFCEKPFGRTAAEGAAIVAAARGAQRRLGAGLNLRGLPPVARLRHAVLEGGVGAVAAVEAKWTRSRVVPGAQPYPPEWYRDREVTGGGVLRDLGAHMIDAALFVIGYPAGELSGYAAGANRLSEAWGFPIAGRFAVEDTAQAVLGYRGGPVLHVHCSWTEQADGQEDFMLKVVGSEGEARAFGRSGKADLRFEMIMRQGRRELPPSPPLVGPLETFFDELSRDREPGVTLGQVSVLVDLMAGLTGSMQTCRPLRLRMEP